MYDMILEKGWANEPTMAPAIAAWEFDFETAVELIARLNIVQAW